MQMFFIVMGLALILVLCLPVWRRWFGMPRAQWWRQAAVLGAFLFSLLSTLRGGIGSGLLALLVMAPVLWHLWQGEEPSNRNPRGSRRPFPASATTRFLRVTASRGTGRLQGIVLAGRFCGKSLAELSLDDLIALHAECRSDPPSAELLEAYLEHTFGGNRGYRHYSSTGDSRPDRMDRAEACAILGLQADATATEIKTAHRRLIQRLHPDQGGSTYLASRINRARDTLLGDAP
jgi:hypothetical protein